MRVRSGQAGQSGCPRGEKRNSARGSQVGRRRAPIQTLQQAPRSLEWLASLYDRTLAPVARKRWAYASIARQVRLRQIVYRRTCWCSLRGGRANGLMANAGDVDENDRDHAAPMRAEAPLA